MFSTGRSLFRGPQANRRRQLLNIALAAAMVATLAAATAGGPSAQAIDTAQRTVAKIAPPRSWKETFKSSFPGTKLNTSAWETCFPWSLKACTNFGNPAQDLEWYLPSQVHVKGGILYLTAQHRPTVGRGSRGTRKVYECRSGMVTTFKSFRFTYGYVQINAHVPAGNGLWPALWLAAANEKWPPEIDILEHWGTQAVSKAYLHPVNGPRLAAVYKSPTIGKGYHTFTLYWTKTRLAWYYDGRLVLATAKHVPHQAMYIVANIADNNVTKKNSCTGSMAIRSIKVWQPKA